MTIEKRLGTVFIIIYSRLLDHLLHPQYLIMQLLLEFIKIQINLNCNSCQAVKNEMLHDYTQVYFVLCNVYWIICAEKPSDFKLPFIIIIVTTINSKKSEFSEK